MPSSILKPRLGAERKHVKSTSLRALAVAARLERGHAPEGPPGHPDGRAEGRPERRTPDPA
ncbi:hypothetical protein [Actinomadura fibrosa]|uniref:Uncharacterized protein n=1 Tax=Actinomadura fibrosa TaxID=111802 RepID=A0ABW2Y148_9ACTN|nr:hypothetical protein [Actinomadura fibrosa]